MYRKKLSKASQELLWSDADRNDSFSDSSYPFPSLQNWIVIARTGACPFLDLEKFNEGCLLLVGSNSVTFFGRIIALPDDAIMDWLIKWTHLAPAVDRSPALNRLCLRAWTQLTYFLSFSTSSVFPLHFAMSRIFISSSVQNAKGVSIISEWPSYFRHYVNYRNRKLDLNEEQRILEFNCLNIESKRCLKFTGFAKHIHIRKLHRINPRWQFRNGLLIEDVFD